MTEHLLQNRLDCFYGCKSFTALHCHLHLNFAVALVALDHKVFVLERVNVGDLSSKLEFGERVGLAFELFCGHQSQHLRPSTAG